MKLHPRVLFMQHEQRQNYWEEPGHIELYMPMVSSGLLGEVRSYPYQRDLRYFRSRSSTSNISYRSNLKAFLRHTIDVKLSNFFDKKKSFRRLSKAKISPDNMLSAYGDLTRNIREILTEFKPDLVVYSATWPYEAVNGSILKYLKDEFNFKIFSVIWDHDESNRELVNYDIELINASDLVAIADSSARAELINRRSDPYSRISNDRANVVFMPMAVDLDVFKPSESKIYDVTIVGSLEGYRSEVYHKLRDKGINVQKLGGLLEGDEYLSHEDYARSIAQSFIVINSQTSNTRVQLKGRVNQVLACGSLLLDQRNQESEKYLSDMGLDDLIWSDIDDLCGKINYWLSDKELCKQRALEARDRYLEKNSPVIWTRKVLDAL